jgi:hypothetical protein
MRMKDERQVKFRRIRVVWVVGMEGRRRRGKKGCQQGATFVPQSLTAAKPLDALAQWSGRSSSTSIYYLFLYYRFIKTLKFNFFNSIAVFCNVHEMLSHYLAKTKEGSINIF